jgi:predicted ribonuclease YlaK
MSRRLLTKTKRNRAERETEHLLNTRFTIRPIQPMTENQRLTFESYYKEKNLLLVGSAGTGKTMVSMYLALKDALTTNRFKEVIIIRSSVQSREQGHMPGDVKEKMAHFEAPYVDIVNFLFERGDAYQLLKQRGVIRFMSTSFIRGLTFDDALIIVDECQNLNSGELRTIITRVGEGSRIIFCGDTKQNDLAFSKSRNDVSGLRHFKTIVDRMGPECFSTIVFTVDDIVRSGLVKQFIIAEEQLESEMT